MIEYRKCSGRRSAARRRDTIHADRIVYRGNCWEQSEYRHTVNMPSEKVPTNLVSVMGQIPILPPAMNSRWGSGKVSRFGRSVELTREVDPRCGFGWSSSGVCDALQLYEVMEGIWSTIVPSLERIRDRCHLWERLRSPNAEPCSGRVMPGKVFLGELIGSQERATVGHSCHFPTRLQLLATCNVLQVSTITTRSKKASCFNPEIRQLV